MVMPGVFHVKILIRIHVPKCIYRQKGWSLQRRQHCLQGEVYKRQHTACPAYDGSVRTSRYPAMDVLNTISLMISLSAPMCVPSNTVPSSKIKNAFILSSHSAAFCDVCISLSLLQYLQIAPLGIRCV